MHIGSDSVARLLGPWRDGPGPAHRRLADSLRLQVLDGRLTLGVAIPSERDLAAALGVSRTTVSTAYRTLIEQGYLEAQARTRAVVRLPENPATVQAKTEGDNLIDLSRGAPAAPVEVLHKAYQIALEQLPRYFAQGGYDARGLTVLRGAVAQWYERRGLPTREDQIMITNGAQHALSVVVQSLISPGDQVIIDHPTYPHAISAFAAARARFIPVALTARGWDLARLREVSSRADFAYLVLDNHNPTGMTMTPQNRARLELQCPAIVDETMADLSLNGSSATPFGCYDDRVISIGSASKSIWGGLRIGWVRASTDTVRRLSHARPILDLGTPYVEQLAAAHLINHLETFLPERLSDLREQRDALRQVLAARLPSWQAPAPHGGISCWAQMPEAMSTRLAATAPDHGLLIAAGPRFSPSGAFERYVRVPYTLDRETLAVAVERLSRAYHALAQGKQGSHGPAPIA